MKRHVPMLDDTFRGIWVVAFREILHFVSDRSRIFSSLMFPLMFLIVFGVGFSGIVNSLDGGIEFTQFVYPGIIAMTVVTSSLLAGTSIVADRERGFLREILVAPLTRFGIIVGKALGGSVTATCQAVIMLLVGPFLGLEIDLYLILKLLPCLFLLSISLSGLGILVATKIRSQQTFQVLLQIMIFPLIFMAGVFFPVEGAPAWLKILAKLNPLTYGVDAVRQIFITPLSDKPYGLVETESISTGVILFGHKMTVIEDILIVFLIGMIFLIAGVWSFSRTEV